MSPMCVRYRTDGISTTEHACFHQSTPGISDAILLRRRFPCPPAAKAAPATGATLRGVISWLSWHVLELGGSDHFPLTLRKTMNTINLTCTVVTNPDSFVGYEYYVKAGTEFDADDYAAGYKLARRELDSVDVQAVREASSKLRVGECLMVSHSIAHSD